MRIYKSPNFLMAIIKMSKMYKTYDSMPYSLYDQKTDSTHMNMQQPSSFLLFPQTNDPRPHKWWACSKNQKLKEVETQNLKQVLWRSKVVCTIKMIIPIREGIHYVDAKTTSAMLNSCNRSIIHCRAKGEWQKTFAGRQGRSTMNSSTSEEIIHRKWKVWGRKRGRERLRKSTLILTAPFHLLVLDLYDKENTTKERW
mgnify:CR=1 FL=1